MVTVTLEHPVLILTSSVDTNIGEKFTLININAVLLVSGAGSHEAHLTLATEGPGKVETLSIGTKCGVLCTLVNILARVTVTGKSSVADTSETSVKIDTLSILVTAPVVSQAFIDILRIEIIFINRTPSCTTYLTVESIACETFLADAVV